LTDNGYSIVLVFLVIACFFTTLIFVMLLLFVKIRTSQIQEQQQGQQRRCVRGNKGELPAVRAAPYEQSPWPSAGADQQYKRAAADQEQASAIASSILLDVHKFETANKSQQREAYFGDDSSSDSASQLAVSHEIKSLRELNRQHKIGNASMKNYFKPSESIDAQSQSSAHSNPSSSKANMSVNGISLKTMSSFPAESIMTRTQDSAIGLDELIREPESNGRQREDEQRSENDYSLSETTHENKFNILIANDSSESQKTLNDQADSVSAKLRLDEKFIKDNHANKKLKCPQTQINQIMQRPSDQS
jgi:hypothetical protein